MKTAISISIALVMTLAVTASAQQSTLDSIVTLRQQLKKNPNNGALLVQLGNLYLRADSADRAVVIFTRAKEILANDALVWEGLGDAYMKQNTPTMAALQYEKALALDSIRPDIRFKLARCYMKDQRYGEAGQMYITLLQQDSTNTSAMLDLGKIFYAAKQPGNASIWLGKYLAAKPEAKEAWPLYLDALYASRQYKAALDAADHVLANDPKHVRALRISATIVAGEGKTADAIERFNRLRQVDTLRADDMHELAKAYASTKNDSLAAIAYEELLTLDPSQADATSELGSVYMRMRKYDLAALQFEKKMKLEPNSPSSYVNFALCNMAQQKWEPAREALVKVTELKPEYAQGHMFLARCYSQMDSARQAQREYETVVKLASAQPEKLTSELTEAHRMIGFYLLIDKKYPQSIESLNASIKLKDDDPQSRLWRAQAYALAGRRDDAVKEYKVVLKLDPKNKEAKKGLEVLGQ